MWQRIIVCVLVFYYLFNYYYYSAAQCSVLKSLVIGQEIITHTHWVYSVYSVWVYTPTEHKESQYKSNNFSINNSGAMLVTVTQFPHQTGC